jgi:hypothetical protein
LLLDRDKTKNKHYEQTLSSIQQKDDWQVFRRQQNRFDLLASGEGTIQPCLQSMVSDEILTIIATNFGPKTC